MFSSVDKALIALIGSVLWLIDFYFGQDWFGHITGDSIGVIISVLNPLLVWLAPNRKR